VEAENAAAKGDSKTLYKIVKELSGHRVHKQQVKLEKRHFLRTQEQMMLRWKGCPEPNVLPDYDVTVTETLDISLNNITVSEVKKAITRLRNGKAAGADQIRQEELEYTEATVPALTRIYNRVWKQQELPADWKDEVIIPLP
jgi:hypothetical protein